jgi:hypothetical protein
MGVPMGHNVKPIQTAETGIKLPESNPGLQDITKRKAHVARKIAKLAEQLEAANAEASVLEAIEETALNDLVREINQLSQTGALFDVVGRPTKRLATNIKDGITTTDILTGSDGHAVRHKFGTSKDPMTFNACHVEARLGDEGKPEIVASCEIFDVATTRYSFVLPIERVQSLVPLVSEISHAS